MKTFNPFKKELPRNKVSGQSGRTGGPMVIPPGALCWTNYNHPGWRSGDSRMEYDCYDRSGFKYHFVFDYVNCGGYYEVDILEYPDCRGRSESSGTIHWLNSARGGKKICIASGKEPRSLSAAHTLSESWALYVARYILTGLTIDQQINQQQRR